MAKILVAEDNRRLAELLEEWLVIHGFEVRICTRGDRVLGQVEVWAPDLVVLDLGLPGLGGLSICRQARARGYAGAILMLTARGEESDEVLGFEVGADDYVTKPVTPGRLTARIRALLRRGRPAAAMPITNGPLKIDLGRRVVELDGHPLDFTAAEFDLLRYLTERSGQLVGREELYRALKGIKFDGLDRSVDQTVSRVRRLLGDDPRRPQWIKTITGQGYLMMRWSCVG